ncbi:hypothetical protein [Methylobacterium gnaphalii]|uniref:Uncharacterized protein n=1 Tax=Methylobacterium gnaphalii TaxID=1010610 RepID=A0A512JQ08_9HYPH|nr:hypothetical protein [Methylobacterium gnaphalii]GEP12021.1 hypothetical protein MGN01_38660 [Methylobacterium gnaphalii]GJD71601.1 hypothetical protein MMMDOFMJ_4564 [Methylobacterium gnaphalii]GLS51232.1 hypothetical protein GCM10007885_40870 [Methylobacterium gnaphalii]
MPRNTAQIADPISGDQLFQQRARRALPLLVRQAELQRPIIYGDLAAELAMPNARNLNYVLGSIGNTIERLAKSWKVDIPPLQALVVNRQTGLPGEGISWFFRADKFVELPIDKKRAVIAGAHAKIYAFPRWRETLDLLSLDYPTPNAADDVYAAAAFGGGEGERHRAFKERVAKQPDLFGLPKGTPVGRTEVPLPSGDRLDVSFDRQGIWVGAEVKPSTAPEPDLVRGLFQCIKYSAVLEAMERVCGGTRVVQVFLVLEGQLPARLIPLRNMLGVRVLEAPFK